MIGVGGVGFCNVACGFDMFLYVFVVGFGEQFYLNDMRVLKRNGVLTEGDLFNSSLEKTWY